MTGSSEEVGVGEARTRLSELIGRAAYRRERFLIRRRGKPMAALVPAGDLEKMRDVPASPQGLLAAVGAWSEYPDIDRFIEEVYERRRVSKRRRVPKLDE